MAGRIFGLIGRNIAYSFSRGYFSEKFKALGLADSYVNFDIGSLDEFPKIVNTPNLSGLNVTIPYKEEIIPLLDCISDQAREIGAVNTISFAGGKTTGHNTDWTGFRDSLVPMLKPEHKSALILGSGGAAKAIVYALRKMGIEVVTVSRNPTDSQRSYDDLNNLMGKHLIVINATPTGTFPNIDDAPPIPYDHFTPRHIAYDLVYNPAETKFLQNAKARGAVAKNGLEMLQLQAEAAWKIWN